MELVCCRTTAPLAAIDRGRHRRSIGGVGVLLYLSLASGCGTDRVAAIQVSVGTDIEEVSWLELRTLAQDGSRILSRGHTTWSRGITHTFNVVPRDNDLDTNPDAVFEVAAGSCAPVDGRLPTACVLVTRRVRAPYVAGVVRVVRVALERACRGVPCAAPQTCVTGTCSDERLGRGAADAGGVADVSPDLAAKDALPDRVGEADVAPDTSADACVRQCAGRACGSDGCGGQCGACSGGATCSTAGACVACATGAECSTGNPCEVGRTRCEGGIVRCDFAENRAAGAACAGGGCDGRGACVPCVGPSQQVCGLTCVHVATDNAHCGGCDRPCPAGVACSSGTCRCAVGTLCGTACVDTQTNPAHCGGCGRACPSGTNCLAGVCMCSGGGLTACGAACVDTQTANAHCGRCNNACPTGQACSGGACVAACSGTQVRCSGVCVNTQTSTVHCGACGRACSGTQVCSAGRCITNPAACNGPACGACTRIAGCGWCLFSGRCEPGDATMSLGSSCGGSNWAFGSGTAACMGM